MTNSQHDPQYSSARSELLTRLHEIDDLSAAAAVLNWDQSTYMPPGGAAARARQSATLRTLAHTRLTDPAIGRLLDAMQPAVDAGSYDDDDAGLLRVVRRDYDRATRIPSQFMADFTAHTSDSYVVWAAARPQNDFATVAPYLEKTLDFSRRYADFFPDAAHVADPLIARADYGMTVDTIRPIFGELRTWLSAFIAQLGGQPQVPDITQGRHFEPAAQLRFGEDIVRRYGYDFNRGRQDLTHHPFCTKFSIGDVRITTRVFENTLGSIFSTMHESGHAMYEQGVDPAFEATPLADGTSSAVHESQSRLWENVVGRSLPFWRGFYPQLQQEMIGQLDGVSLMDFYRAINCVQPSLIRVDADEVTYGLHVIIRFELELALLEGKLSIAELPEAWNAKYNEFLGVQPVDYRDGVMQDVHWYADFIGGVFQGYALGNILSAQFYAAALQAHPSIPTEIEAGEFATLHTWLRENIYRYGSKYTTTDLLQRITGGPIRLEPYKNYLRNKYDAIYGIEDVEGVE